MVIRHKHATDMDEEMQGKHLSINAIEACTDILECITSEEIREVTLEDEHLSTLAELKFCGRSSTKA